MQHSQKNYLTVKELLQVVIQAEELPQVHKLFTVLLLPLPQLYRFADLPYIQSIKYILYFLHMELAKIFEGVTSCQSINISTLDTNKKYPSVRTKRLSCKFGQTVLLTIRESKSTTVQIFL